MTSQERPPRSVLRRRIHVGCGPLSLKPDWWNVDIRAFEGVDEVRDVTLPWDGLSKVTHVYAEHFLEHLGLEQACDFLKHAQNAMEATGRIRLTTPSLEWVHQTHLTLPATSRDDQVHQTLAINRAFKGWGHQFLWSRGMLEHVLGSLGYRQLTFCDYGISADPLLHDQEQHGGFEVVEGYPSVWIVEASAGAPADTTKLDHLLESLFYRQVRSGH